MPFDSGRLLAAVIATHPEIMLRFDRISLVYGGNHSVSDFDRAFLRYRTLAEQMQGDHMDMLQETLVDIDRRAQMVREETLQAADVQKPASRRRADATRAPVTPVQENASSAPWAIQSSTERTVAQFSSVGPSPTAPRPDATRALVTFIPELPSSARHTIPNGPESTVPQYSSISQDYNARWTDFIRSPIDLTEDRAERTVAKPSSTGQNPPARQVGATRVLANPFNASSARRPIRDGSERTVAESSSIKESPVARQAASTRTTIDLTEDNFAARQAIRNGAENGVTQYSSAARASPAAQAVLTGVPVDVFLQDDSSAHQNIPHGAEVSSAAPRVVAPRPPVTPVGEIPYMAEQALRHAAGHGFREGVATPPGFLDNFFFADYPERARPGSINYNPGSNNHWRCNAFGSPITPGRSLEVGMHGRQIGGPVVTRETLEVSIPVNQPEFPFPFGPQNDDTTDTYQMTDIEARQHGQLALDLFSPGGDIGNHGPECGYRGPFLGRIPWARTIHNGLVEWYDPRHPPSFATHAAAGQPASNNTHGSTNTVVNAQTSAAMEVIDLVSETSSESESSSTISQHSIAFGSSASGHVMGMQGPSPFAGIQGSALQGTGVHLNSEDYSSVGPALLDPMLEVFRDLNRAVHEAEDGRLEEHEGY